MRKYGIYHSHVLKSRSRFCQRYQLKTTLVVDSAIPGLKNVLVPGKNCVSQILFSVTVVVMIQLKQNSPTKA